MRTLTRPITAALAVLVLALTGCGSKLVVVHSSVLRLRLDEYQIIPQLVQVPAGRLKIVAFNTGILTHNARVEATYSDKNGNPIVLGGTPPAHPGQIVIGKLVLAPGTYKLLDTIANHADLGDFATLIVK